MKKTVFCIVVLIVALSVFSGCLKNNTDDDADNIKLSGAISEAILSQNESTYLQGECQAEGHIALTTEKKGDNTVCYVIASYGEYGFEDGNFIKVSGSGAIPCRITFDGDMKVSEFKYPEDGAGYNESIKEMYGEKFSLFSDFSRKNENLGYGELSEQEKVYAKAYLEKIGRADCLIGEYADFTHPLLTGEGVDVEVSNRLMDDSRLYDYPFWIGNREVLEDGVRYVYEVSLDKDANEIIYRKYNYNDRKTIEEFKFDLNSGEELDR